MTSAYSEIAFTDAVKSKQTALGSRRAYAEYETQPGNSNAEIGEAEAAFLAQRDSFYMASVSETGWPYLQHRGGPAGLVRVLDPQTLGFAEFSGNRQYVTLGKVAGEDRVSLFFMDYLNRRRLKVFGRSEVIDQTDRRFVPLPVEGYRGRIESGVLIHVAAYDWNCPQHITERFTLTEVEAATSKLTARIAELEAELADKRQTGHQ